MKKIRKFESFAWSMSFVGTGIGAGILFLPVQAGIGGVKCFLLSAVVAFSFSYISHKIYAKLAIDSEKPKDYPGIIREHLGSKFSLIMAILFFILVFLYLVVYIIGLNVAVGSFLFNLGVTSTHLNETIWFPLLILCILLSLMSCNEKVIIKIMSIITFPLILMLIFLAFYLIPHWDITNLTRVPSIDTFTSTFFYNIPILIFAAMFFPPITTMVTIYKKQTDLKTAEVTAYRTIKIAQFILLGFTIFFTISCVMATNPTVVRKALNSNESILLVLSTMYEARMLKYFAPFIAIFAIITSFLGYYIGAKEIAKNLIKKYLQSSKNNLSIDDVLEKANSRKTLLMINVAIGIVLLFVAVANMNIEKIMQEVCGPLTAIILYFVPFYILKTSPKYKNFGKFGLWFLFLGGFLLIFAYILGYIASKLL